MANRDSIQAVQLAQENWCEYVEENFDQFYSIFDYIKERSYQLALNAEHFGEIMEMSFGAFAAELRFVPWNYITIEEVPLFVNWRALKYIGLNAWHGAYDAYQVSLITLHQIFDSREFAAYVEAYLSYPGTLDAILNNNIDWASLKNGAIYYGTTLAVSAYNDAGLQQAFFDAHSVADGYRAVYLQYRGY